MLNKSLPSHPIEGSSGGRIHRSASESVANPHAIPAKTGPFSHFLRRKKTSVEDALPPPTPPKDTPCAPQASPPNVPPHTREDSSELAYYGYRSPKNSVDYHQGHDYTQGLSRPRHSSVSDVIHITHDESDMVVIEPQRPPTMLETKWAAEPFMITDPAERARRRIEARKQQEEEDRMAVQEEEERQRKLKLKKQAIMEQEREDEFLRRVQLDKELRDATTERMRREREIKEEEQARAWEVAEKKRIDKERKAEEARKLEHWRAEEQKKSREILKRQEEEIQRKERERKARVKVIEAKIRKSSATELMTGWVTVQNSNALILTWKRRYFKFVGSKMSLYRTPKDISQPVDSIELGGRVSALREWHEGYEELQALDHSFALEFKDGQGPWSMFCDSEDDKVRLQGLLHQAAGLKL